MSNNALHLDANKLNDRENAHVQLCIMGHFDLQIGGHPLSEPDNHISKRRSIVAYLILHRNRAIPHEELLRRFYEDEDPCNLTAALKMQIGRIRKRLSDHLEDGVDAIISKRGSYQWNPELTCWVDIEAFDRLCLEAESIPTLSTEKIKLYAQALAMYTGDLVLEKDNLLWSKALSARYRSKYVSAVERYADLLLACGDYKTAETAYLKAIEKDPTNENLYALLIQSLAKQNRFADAKTWYKKISDTLHKSLGVRPSEELQHLYADCIEGKNAWEQDLSLVMENMRDTSEKREAFFCTFEQFKNIYQLEVRRAAREGGCLHVAMLTVFGVNGTVLSPDISNNIMERVRQVIVQNLRQSDVVAQYSSCQFIIMLPYANLEDSQMVLDRIMKAYHIAHPRSAIHFSYQIRELESL